ncbi:MFS transporter [Luteimicrobium subarcticum]|uniref:Fucose permease n=1 Tax=Luteimicrobium subarcticum TaxID=620910 RepID=A0A2M8WUG6_9MICO|nr:MFS transporter [Luteimicrobium subarcticum]PJI94554.1 fucose permease [Luteimicrobium subarcticum]
MATPALETVVPPHVRRTRLSLLGVFALFGLASAAWLSRLPTVRTQLGVSDAQLGAILTTGAVGALCAVIVSGAVVARFGSRTTLVFSSWVFVVATATLGLALATRSVPLLVVGLFVNGVTGALTNVPINTNAAAVERAMGRSVMSQFHATFSVGAVAGSALGALCAHLEVGLPVQLFVTAAFVGAARLALVPSATALTRGDQVDGTKEPQVDPRIDAALADPGAAETLDPPPARRRGGAVRAAAAAWREPRTVLIGLVVLAASLSEGTASNWLPIAVGDGFGQADATAALVLTTFTASMTLVRALGPQIVDRLGRTRTLVVSGTVATVGLLAFGLAPSFALAWVGVLLWGFGAALANPVALTAAADEPQHAPVRVSVVTTFGSVAQLSAPPVLGLLVDGIGARHTLTLIVVAMVVSVAASPAVRPIGAAALRTRR